MYGESFFWSWVSMGVHFLGLAASMGIQFLSHRTGSSVGLGEEGVVNILSSYFLGKFS